MVDKIKAACRARRSKNFLIIARTDGRGVKGMADAIERGRAYQSAGADLVFPEALRTKAEFQIFSKQMGPGTLMANMTEFGISPALTVSECVHLGYRVVLFPMTAFRTAAFSIKKAYRRLKREEQSKSLLRTMQTRKELYRLIGYKG